MATKNTTEIEFVAKGKGFEEQKRKADKLAQSVNPKRLGAGFTHMQKQMGSNIGAMKALNKEVVGITKALGQFDKVVDKLDKMSDGLKKANKEGKELKKTMAASGAFTQGFLQSMPGMAPFLQRGPGMKRQAAGMVAGGAVRSSFAGLQGLSQGISNIPGIGLLAGPIQAAIQGSQENLQLMQTEESIKGIGGDRSVASAAGRAARARVMRRRFEPSVFQAEAGIAGIENLSKERLAKTHRTKGQVTEEEFTRAKSDEAMLRKAFPDLARGASLLAPTYEGHKRSVLATERSKHGQEESRREEDFKKKRIADANRAASAASAKEMMGMGFGDLARDGGRFGLNIKQSRERQLQLLQSGGGAARDTGQIFEASLGAEKAFGVGAQTSSQFLRAQRQGGLVGQSGSAGDMLTESIRNAMWAGNEGQELVDAMNRTAQGIQQFQQTGIPFADQSISKMSRGLQLGMGTLSGRGGSAAAAIAERAQDIAKRGAPADALEAALLRQVGGLSGGMVGFEKGMGRLRRGDIGGFEGFKSILTNTIGGPGMKPGATDQEAASAREQIQRTLSRLNAGSFTEGKQGEREGLRRAITGEAVDPDSELGRNLARSRERLEISGSGAKKAASTEAMIKAGQANIDGRRKRQAGIETDRLAKTRALLTTTQNLAQSQNNLLSAVEKLAPVTNQMTETMGDMTKMLPEFIEFMKWAIKKSGITSSEPGS